MQKAVRKVQGHTNCFDLKHLQVLHSEDLADGSQQGEHGVGLQLHSPEQLRQKLQCHCQTPRQSIHLSWDAAAKKGAS